MNINIKPYTAVAPYFYAQYSESPLPSSTVRHYEDAVTSRKYIIGSLTDAGISFATMPATHTTAASARLECDRLAQANPGKTYIYCQLIGGTTLPTGLKRL